LREWLLYLRLRRTVVAAAVAVEVAEVEAGLKVVIGLVGGSWRVGGVEWMRLMCSVFGRRWRGWKMARAGAVSVSEVTMIQLLVVYAYGRHLYY
jgi:hypothetical protein